MPRYVAFLRAINVSGRFIKTDTLAAHFRALGLGNVRTFINSGNVIFDAPESTAAALGQALDSGLEPLLGFRADAFVRSPSQVRTIAKRAAEHARAMPSTQDVNVLFLARPLSAAQRAVLDTLRSTVDDFACVGSEIYWLSPQQQAASTFSNALFERRFATRATLRRASMLQRLAAELRTEGNA